MESLLDGIVSAATILVSIGAMNLVLRPFGWRFVMEWQRVPTGDK